MLDKSLLIVGLAAALAACGGPDEPAKFNATDITGAEWARGFDLPDYAGKRRTLADFRGKVVLVFFGYTSCPDACPTALAEMAQVVDRLGPDGARVQGLFITVDPERDTPERLARYVTAFHPSFLGLRGIPDEVEKTAKEFKVYFRTADQTPAGHAHHDGGYMVDHATAIFVFDPQGRVRLYVSQTGRAVDAMVADLRRLLAASRDG
jgi:protein SCO1/2